MTNPSKSSPESPAKGAAMKIYFLLYILAAFLYGWASRDLDWLNHEAMVWAFPWITGATAVLILGLAILGGFNAQDNR